MWAHSDTGNRHIRASVKRAVRARQRNTCACIDPAVCTGSIDEFDHILNCATSGTPRGHATARDTQGLCHRCHVVKTQAEAHAAKHAKRYRTPQPHPGLMR